MQKVKKRKPKGLYRKILDHVKVFWPFFIIIIVASAGYSLCDTYIIGPFVKRIVNSWGDIEFLRTVPFILVSVFFLRGIAGFLSAYFIGYVSRSTVKLFRNLIFEKFSKLPVDFIDKISSAELTSKLTYNVELITEASGNTLITFIRDGCLVMFLLAYMVWTSWLISIIIILVLPIIGILVYFVSKRFRVLGRRLQASMGSVTKLCIEVLQGYQDVRIFNAQDRKTKQFNEVIEYNYQQEMKVALLNSLNSPVIQFVCVCVLSGVIAFIFHGKTPLLSSGAFVSIIGATAMLLKPIKNLTGIQSTIQKGLAAAESVFELLEYKSEPVLNPRGRKNIDWKIKGKIEFNKVSFSYDKTKTKIKNKAIALTDISFTMKPGEIVALVGPSGAGKSTIMKILTQFYDPTSGEILLDKTSISQIKLQDYRSNFALVSQNIHLFDETVSQNLLFSKPDATEEQMIAALKMANAWDFIEKLPNKLDTMLGEQALSLSGGQRQRLAIARAILKDAPILLLDEATSALDTASEASIQAALDSLSKSRTTLVIAHRLSTVKNADQIIYLEEGKVIEKGTYDQLLDKKGKFYEMHKSGIK